MTTYMHDPDAVLDYQVDWSAWLAESETISSYTITVTGTVTVDSDTDDGASVTVWLSGAADDERPKVACRITTNQGRTDERTFDLSVRDR